MKDADEDLVALLATDDFVDCDLYTLTLADGSVLRYTTADVDVTVDDHTWSASTVRIDTADNPATGHWKVGLDVDSWQAKFIPRHRDDVTGVPFPDKIGTTQWRLAAAGGALDGAELRVERAFLEAWPTPWQRNITVEATGTLAIFLGRVAEVDIGAAFVVVNANDYRELLTVQVPRNLYQSGCRHTLFDAGCTLDKAAYATAGAVAAGSAAATINTALPQAAGYYDLGRLIMTSGANAGFGRAIRSWDGAALKLIAPFYFPLATGDTFNVYPGCDKTVETCNSKFANKINFGGQPFIPAASTAL